ncbi:hypothetical protein ANACOL_02382 [Anaerotruncus colihominis DSM 17241]|uniref:Uncharacterized protein n=1 Tax=Anaerotruncus colihominis DSM 17241 TaxID=445972 RepID=B0PC73_9FIRM|nr:hypothetical protein ANACOL_02382 [Anaerotruncus colihominis DSM 17241]
MYYIPIFAACWKSVSLYHCFLQKTIAANCRIALIIFNSTQKTGVLYKKRTQASCVL